MLQNAGSVFITTPQNGVISNANNITVTATGSSSDIVVATDAYAVGVYQFTSATVTLSAGRDLVVAQNGVQGVIVGGGSVSLHAGRNITFNTGAAANATANFNATMTAGGNITFMAGAQFVGAVLVQTGRGGVLSTLPGSSLVSQGVLTLRADSMTLQGDMNGVGGRVILEPVTLSRPIVPGSKTAPGSLDLDSTDLHLVQNASVLQIGTSQDTGGITVAGAIEASASWSTLSLVTAGAVREAGGLPPVQVPNLAVHAGTGVSLLTFVSTLAFSNKSGPVAISNFSTSLTVAAVDGLTSSINSGAATNLTTTGNLTFAASTSCPGTLTALTENNDLTLGNADITVDTGVTVSSRGNLLFEAFSNIDVQSGATLMTTGALTLNIGYQNVSGANNSVIAGRLSGLHPTVQGTGADSLLIYFSKGASPPAGLTFRPGPGSTLTINDAGSTGAHHDTLSPAR